VAAVEISVHDAKALLDSGAAVRLIDCREQDEHALCKIERSQLIPLSVFRNEAPANLEDKNQTILIYCHHGMRSMRAAEYLAALGYTDARSIRGGIEAWSQEIDPAVPRY
jgi:rhodanese-related sulfurtransferase